MASKLRFSATHELRSSQMLSNICAILLDLDGVVIDSEPAHERSLIEASDRLGRRIILSDTKQFKGSTELDCARTLREMTNSAENLSRIMQLRIDAFRTLFKEVTLVEGVLLFLRRCKAKKWPVALTTSAQRDIQELDGVRSAKAAGCQTVGITTSFSSDTLLAAGADIVVRGFAELGKILFEEVDD